MKMITCYLRYVIDPYKMADFEVYARLWIPLVNHFGGRHHGYFLPHEGANNVAVALFSFPSLAAYETYRQHILTDKECQAAFAFAETTRCILSYERSFLRPIFGNGEDASAAEQVASHADHELCIRAVSRHDLEALIELCAEHAAYEGARYDPQGKAGNLALALFTAPPRLHAWVVEQRGHLVGYATATQEFSTWDACTGYLAHPFEKSPRESDSPDSLPMDEQSGYNGRGWEGTLMAVRKNASSSTGSL